MQRLAPHCFLNLRSPAGFAAPSWSDCVLSREALTSPGSRRTLWPHQTGNGSNPASTNKQTVSRSHLAPRSFVSSAKQPCCWRRGGGGTEGGGGGWSGGWRPMDSRARSAADGPPQGPARRPCLLSAVPAQGAAALPAPPSADGAGKSGELFSVLLRSRSWMSFSESGTGFYLEHCSLLSTGGKCVFRP